MPKTYLIIILCTTSFWLNWPFINHLNHYALHFLDIGQGDAILIRSPTNCTIFIDGGPDNKLTDDLSKTLPVLENQIDLLVLTHPHADHMNGLISLLNRYEVKSVFITGISYSNPTYTEFNHLINQKGTQIYYVQAPQKYELCGIQFEIIYPINSEIGQSIENINNSSIVMRVKIKDNWVYLNGDAELEEEHEILEAGFKLDSDIMKAGHHGSRTSNSLEMLKAVSPKELVIQSGVGNSYLHPHPETLQKAKELGIKVKRNDIRGTISYYF